MTDRAAAGIRAMLGLQQGLPALTFLDDHNVNRMQLMLSRRGGSDLRLSFFDNHQQPRLTLFISPDGTPGITMRGSEGGLGLSFVSMDGKDEANLGVEKGPLPTLRLFGKKGEIKARFSPESTP